MTDTNNTAVAPVCTIDGCEKPILRKGWCAAHYARNHRSGDPVGRADRIRWFLRDLIATPTDECVLWPFGALASGYGKGVKVGSRTMLAHRLALVALTGENPKGLLACHGPCHNRLCVNPHPQHGMRWGTRQDNVDDMVRDGSRLVGQSVSGARLSDESVRRIHALYAQGVLIREIATEFECSCSAITEIAHAKSRRNLGLPALPLRNPRIVG